MRSLARSGWTLAGGVATLFVGCMVGGNETSTGSVVSAASGAAFTTFDATQGGCLDSSNGVNCNHYASASAVYVNGGPASARMPDGTYFFAVVVPGHQRGGFMDGARGNLSDTFAGGTDGDRGAGDPVANRTFSVAGGVVTYAGTHAMGVTPNGHPVIRVAPFDVSSNDGGVSILAVCEAGATRPSQCRYDAFHADPAPGDGGPDGGGPGVPDAGTPTDDVPPSIMPDVPEPPGSGPDGGPPGEDLPPAPV